MKNDDFSFEKKSNDNDKNLNEKKPNEKTCDFSSKEKNTNFSPLKINRNPLLPLIPTHKNSNNFLGKMIFQSNQHRDWV